MSVANYRFGMEHEVALYRITGGQGWHQQGPQLA